MLAHAAPAARAARARPPLQGPTYLTILPTYRCTAACRECCFESNPRHTRRVPLRRILRYIDEAADTFGTLRVVVFSGGECFLLGSDLVRGVQRAAARGLAVRCVSNGYWAVNEAAARAWMERLAEAGLRELNLSTGDDHQEYVPFDRVAMAAEAAAASGVRTLLVVEGHSGSRFRPADALAHPRLQDFIASHPRSDLLSLVQSIWIPFRDDRPLAPPSSAAAPETGGCTNVLDNLVVTPDEQLAACCGLTMEHIPEMKLGSLRRRRMGDLYRRALADFMKLWLRVEGPHAILEFARARDPLLLLPDSLPHICQACAVVHRNPAVRRVIKGAWKDKQAEILFRFHLQRRLQARALATFDRIDPSPSGIATEPSSPRGPGGRSTGAPRSPRTSPRSAKPRAAGDAHEET
jgi:hypothetical protein